MPCDPFSPRSVRIRENLSDSPGGKLWSPKYDRLDFLNQVEREHGLSSPIRRERDELLVELRAYHEELMDAAFFGCD